MTNLYIQGIYLTHSLAHKKKEKKKKKRLNKQESKDIFYSQTNNGSTYTIIKINVTFFVP